MSEKWQDVTTEIIILHQHSNGPGDTSMCYWTEAVALVRQYHPPPPLHAQSCYDLLVILMKTTLYNKGHCTILEMKFMQFQQHLTFNTKNNHDYYRKIWCSSGDGWIMTQGQFKSWLFSTFKLPHLDQHCLTSSQREQHCHSSLSSGTCTITTSGAGHFTGLWLGRGIFFSALLWCGVGRFTAETVVGVLQPTGRCDTMSFNAFHTGSWSEVVSFRWRVWYNK